MFPLFHLTFNSLNKGIPFGKRPEIRKDLPDMFGWGMDFNLCMNLFHTHSSFLSFIPRPFLGARLSEGGNNKGISPILLDRHWPDSGSPTLLKRTKMVGNPLYLPMHSRRPVFRKNVIEHYSRGQTGIPTILPASQQTWEKGKGSTVWMIGTGETSISSASG